MASETLFKSCECFDRLYQLDWHSQGQASFPWCRQAQLPCFKEIN